MLHSAVQLEFGVVFCLQINQLLTILSCLHMKINNRMTFGFKAWQMTEGLLAKRDSFCGYLLVTKGSFLQKEACRRLF